MAVLRSVLAQIDVLRSWRRQDICDGIEVLFLFSVRLVDTAQV